MNAFVAVLAGAMLFVSAALQGADRRSVELEFVARNWPAAIEGVESLCQAFPLDPELMTLRGRVWRAAGRQSELVQCLESHQHSLPPDEPIAWLRSALLPASSAERVRRLSEIVEKCPTFTAARLARAEILARHGQARVAWAPLQSVAADLHGADATRATAIRALAELESGDLPSAEQTSSALIAKEPDRVSILIVRAHVLVEAGRLAAARQCLDRVLFMAPASLRGRELSVEVLLLQGNHDEAQREAEMAATRWSACASMRALPIRVLGARRIWPEARERFVAEHLFWSAHPTLRFTLGSDIAWGLQDPDLLRTVLVRWWPQLDPEDMLAPPPRVYHLGLCRLAYLDGDLRAFEAARTRVSSLDPELERLHSVLRSRDRRARSGSRFTVGLISVLAILAGGLVLVVIRRNRRGDRSGRGV